MCLADQYSRGLQRITTNLCLNLIRDRHPTLPLDQMNEPTDPAGDPEALFLTAWNRTIISETIARLPPLYRMAVMLRHQEGLSYEEVAPAMEMPLGTVKTYLFRGRQMLRQMITGQRGGESVEV